ncbi:pentatricopeptide repeat-containing protein 1, mitochondrial-like [Clavelina lepadiformis]|uniref:pentatricopeptide repeat-containing protein 1, mitochondrial-like n=1 Tax=Clavelina lepadiformis TaxID=159417 RepID=UPI0040436F6F
MIRCSKLCVTYLAGSVHHRCIHKQPILRTWACHTLFQQHENRSIVKLLAVHFGTEPIKSTQLSALGVDLNPNDTFGLIANQHNIKVFSHPQDDDTTKYVKRCQEKSAFWYHVRCKKLARQGKIDECVKLFEKNMLEEDKVQPQEYNFSVVIGALGRAGDVRRALKMFKKAKEYGLTPSLPCYTGIFNAFCNAHNGKDVEILRRFYEKVKVKKIPLNRISYNALLKAYASHTSLQETMSVFRDSLAAGIEPDIITFTNLISACESDKENGFRHACQVWKRMICFGCYPAPQTLVQLLRVVLRCNIGDLELANKVLLQNGADATDIQEIMKNNFRQFRWLKGQESSPKSSKPLENTSPDLLMLTALPASDTKGLLEHDKQEVNIKKNDLKVSETSGNDAVAAVGNVPSLLQTGAKSALVAITECPKPADRFSLIGGLDGVLDIMKKYKIPASAKLLSAIAQVLGQTDDEENKLMTYAEKSGAKLDVDFYNCILYKRAKRYYYTGSLEVIERLKVNGLVPSYRTWCIQALLCRNYQKGRELLEGFKKENIEPDLILFHTLIIAALKNPKNLTIRGYTDVRSPDYEYLIYIIKQLMDYKIKANEDLVRLLEKAANWPEGYSRWKVCDPKFEKRFLRFRRAYKQWLNNADVIVN